MDYGYNAAANRPRSPLRGPAAVRDRHRTDGPLACPDQRIDLTAVVAERDLVAVRLTCTGTHNGRSLLGAEPSGKAIRYEGLVICRVKDGRIFEQWGGFDSLGLAQQLGLARAGTWPAPSVLPTRGSPEGGSPAGTPREVVRGYWEATFNDRSFGSLEEVVGPAFVDHCYGAVDRPEERGADGLRIAEESFLGVFPDCRVRVDELFAADDLVCARLSSRGTHRGEWLGTAPTGRTFSYEGTFIWRLRGGKLTDRWGGFDRLWMARQVGAVDRGVESL